MKKKKYYHYTAIIFYFFVISCSSQDNPTGSPPMRQSLDRPAAFAGQFYPADKSELLRMLDGLFKIAEPKREEHPLAIISPHAGFLFSGKVAASGFNQLDTVLRPENIFIIGSSHTTWFEGASVYSTGDFITPLGTVKVNCELAQKLISENDVFISNQASHLNEHSIEVQLPYLQYLLKENFQIVPIIIGSQSKEISQKIAQALKPYFNESNLFIISSDFSHYPGNRDAIQLDNSVAEIILQNNTELFLNEVGDAKNNKIQGLVTRACGWTSILTLLYLTDHSEEMNYKLITYENSADSKYGDTTHVVGYNSVIVVRTSDDNSGFYISPGDAQSLISIAKNTIETYISTNKIPVLDPKTIPGSLQMPCGAFVTIKKNGQLRGCIGRFDATEPLYKVVHQMAIAASTQDTRFLPVSKSELKDLDIEISVLSPLKKINSVGDIVLGKHGIYIKKGSQSGTFLPQVATETGWSLVEFLGHCSRDKAGLGWDGWKDAEIFIYEALVFSE